MDDLDKMLLEMEAENPGLIDKVNAALERRELKQEIERLRSALNSVKNRLAPWGSHWESSVSCEGCKFDIMETLRIVGEALDY